MQFNDQLIKKILLAGNYVSKKEIEKAENYVKDYRGSIVDYLFSQNLLSKDILGQAIADYSGFKYSDLNSKIPSKEQVLLIPEETAKNLRIVVFSQNKSEIIIATDNPEQEKLKETIQSFFPGKKIKLTFSMPSDVDDVFVNYYQGFKIDLSKITEKKQFSAPEVITKILEDALLLKSSDIHFEPEEEKASIRFRIDGILQDVGQLPKEYYENIVSRLKVQAKLRIDEHFSAQDGAIRFSSLNHQKPIDLRISIMPILEGEKIVIRILSSYVRDLNLSDIGLSDSLQEQIMKSIKKPFGMILVTGPTGSGKTTTLYSIIKILNSRKRNITTIEDPVEYKIQGVNQTQVNQQTNLTFAKSLRAIMRQDPNIIFVGEIRDLETAEIAVNAALTGHLLLSTFHTNNAVSAVPRLIDMGTESFLLGSTLELIIAQRLVRKVCDFCKVGYILTKIEIKKINPELIKFFKEDSITLYKGKGCESCSNTGYKGRIGVFEFLAGSTELQDVIAKNPTSKDVLILAQKQGFKSMFEDGIDKVRIGITSLEELLRVVDLN